MTRPAAVVFDLDGTLLDSRRDIATATNHALAQHGLKQLSEAEIARYVGDGARLLVSRAARLGEDDPELSAVLDTFLKFYNAHAAVESRLLPGALDTLTSLSPLPLALCTNKPRATTDVVLEAFDLARYFRVIVAGGDVPEKKPDPAPLRFIAARLGLATAELVMVGDGPQDILAGRAADARTVAIVGPLVERERLVAAEPDTILDSLSQLPAVITRWRS